MTDTIDTYAYRHIRSGDVERLALLSAPGYETVEAVMADAVPPAVQRTAPGPAELASLPEPLPEQ